jgi:antagonist of KipI
MSIEVLAPGLLTTVQACGRAGFRHLGVGLGGALDPETQAIANLLAGNATSAATLEIALAGPTLRFQHAARIAPWWIDPHALDADPSRPIRVLPGSDATDPGDGLFATEWTVAPASDRQGLRLAGTALALRDGREYVSEPIVPGTVQLPPDGQPIVLLADAQTHGGYPRIGHVIRADRGRLAQLRAGDAIRFAPCTPAEAGAASRERAHSLARIALAVAGRIGVAPLRPSA